MQDRPITRQQRTWLQDELDDWLNAGIVDAPTVERIQQRYITEDAAAVTAQGKIVYALMSISALLAGIAVLLLVGFNWQAIPVWGKLAFLFGLMGAVYAGALHLRFVRRDTRLSEVLFFLGSLVFGANIWLVQQSFNVSASPSVGLMWWAIGVAPFVLLFDRLLFHTLFAGLLILWSLCDTFFGSFLFMGGWRVFDQDIVPVTVLPILGLAGLLHAHRTDKPALVRLYLPVLILPGIRLLAVVSGDVTLLSLGILGILLLLVSERRRLADAMQTPYRHYGILLTGWILLYLGYHATFAISDNYRNPSAPSGQWQSPLALLIFAIYALGGAYLLTRLLREWTDGTDSKAGDAHGADIERSARTVFLSLLALFACCLAFFIVGNGLPSSVRIAGALLLTVLANAGSVALAIWFIIRALRLDAGHSFSLGVGYLMLWICLRYFDLFGDLGGMLGASGLFAVCALTLFAVASYWRNRKGVKNA